MFISFISSLESMYLIYRKHKLCRSLVVRWWFGGFSFWCSSRCDRGCCLVTLSRRLLLTGCTNLCVPPSVGCVQFAILPLVAFIKPLRRKNEIRSIRLLSYEIFDTVNWIFVIEWNFAFRKGHLALFPAFWTKTIFHNVEQRSECKCGGKKDFRRCQSSF